MELEVMLLYSFLGDFLFLKIASKSSEMEGTEK